jgi:hypothetical protein
VSNPWWVFFLWGFFFSLALVYGGEAIASRTKLEEHKFSQMAARRLPPPAPASSPGNSSCFPITLLSVAPPFFRKPFCRKPYSQTLSLQNLVPNLREETHWVHWVFFDFVCKPSNPLLQTLCRKPLLQNPKSQTLFLNLRIERPNGFIGSSSILFSCRLRSLLIQFVGSFPLQSHRLSVCLSVCLYSPRV